MADAAALPTRVLNDLLTFGDADKVVGAVLRWLLDAQADHGLEGALVERLAAFLEAQEESELAMALPSGFIPVTSEVVSRDGGCDLVVSLGGQPKLALISMARLTAASQSLAEYAAAEVTAIALRPPAQPMPQAASLPVWDWISDLDAVSARLVAGPEGDFVRQVLAHDPSASGAGSSSVDLGRQPAALASPPPAAPPPGPSAPPAPPGGVAPPAGGPAPARPAAPPARPAAPLAPPAPRAAPPPPRAAPPPPRAAPPAPRPAPPAPRPAAPPPAAPGGGWGGGDLGGGLSDGWMDGGGGGGLSDGWMNP
jgi:hypothetical protein